MSSRSPAIILYDADGNPIATPVVEGVRRLAVDVRQEEGQAITVTVGQDVPANLNRYVSAFATNNGSSNLIVNGSVTPVNFDYMADPTKNITLNEVRVVASAQDIAFDGGSFGGLAALTNGLTVEIINGDGTQVVFNIKRNEDFLFFPSPVGMLLNNTGPKDVLSAGFFLGGSVLRAGTTDRVRIIAQDNLMGGGANQFSYLQARVFGVKAA